MKQASLRHVPSVEKLLHALGAVPGLPRAWKTAAVRIEVDRLRAALAAGATPESFDETVARMRGQLESLARTRLQPLINGTGVILHTNLGRAPLGPRVADALCDLAGGYCNLELDLESGERGHRGAFVEHGLALLCDAPAATLVNNCAAALVLILRVLTRRGKNEVVISRGELVEIGGGFRVPDILATSGAKLREIGTTNKTSLADYEAALGPKTALILKVHRSNFFIEGFTDRPGISELADLAHEHGLPLVEDLGSGAIEATERLNDLEHEPTPAASLGSGIDLVCFSGDKLLGGPQAGIIAGRSDLVQRLKKDPFFRALRCDKLILAAMQETVTEFLNGTGDGPAPVPVVQMLRLTAADLLPRAEKIIAALPGELHARPGSGTSRCGGGTMPKSSLPSVTIDMSPASRSVDDLADRLRTGHPPVVGYVADGVFKLDLRTVLPTQDEALIAAVMAAV